MCSRGISSEPLYPLFTTSNKIVNKCAMWVMKLLMNTELSDVLNLGFAHP